MKSHKPIYWICRSVVFLIISLMEVNSAWAVEGRVQIDYTTKVGEKKKGNHSESGKIRVATCQFPVSTDIKENYGWIKMKLAS